MRYLFFDIECANCFGTAKICSFGYVLTRMDFTVIKKEDIVINPRSKFYKPPDKHNPGAVIEPAYPREVYRLAPEFPAVYQRIRDLLCDPEHIVIGHAPQNDAKFLLQTCARYKLPTFDYRFYDNQALYASFADPDAKLGLESVCETLGIPVLHTHCSMDDAYMTMRTAAALAKREKTSLPELFATRPCTCWRVLSGYLMRMTQKNGFSLEPKDGGERMKWLLYAAQLAKKNACDPHEPLRFIGSNRVNRTRGKELTACLARIEKARSKKGPLVGKRVAIGVGYTNHNLVQTAYLAARIAALGGIYDQASPQFDMLALPPENVDFYPCFRYRAAKARQEHGKNVEIISFADLLAMLSVDEAWLSRVEYPPELAEKLAEKK